MYKFDFIVEDIDADVEISNKVAHGIFQECYWALKNWK